ncbi:cyclopropane-fatty-acyl-phospholipid synthase family protein [Saccharopolyspora sp. NPDC049357]|uniref:cyclopropane-fatty-acyl-phospholipid synthase family protein n=1 Tax=Saccharopolyspora sp. NPDC049357 TaxID=3154507 RepID=UPI00341FBB1F
MEEIVGGTFGVPLPIGVRAWDGSHAGPASGPQVVLRRRAALRHFLWSPGELGLARAFVSGDLDVDGDLIDGLRRCWAAVREHELSGWGMGAREWRDVALAALRLGAVGPRPRIPAAEARLSGRLHTRWRDRAAIAHHYDVGNDFYALLLDPAMAYSCGYFPTGEEDLPTAQEAKLELICRKLGLRPGMRLLDVGCGWGSLVLHAARYHGVEATGITLSRSQFEHIERRVTQLGLQGRVRVRLEDYRELAGVPYDAVASVEMGEHVGESRYADYVATLHRMLRPRGRLLLQQMSRGDAAAPGGGAFISSYIAPDMTMVPVGRTVERLEAGGFEVRDVEAMREHYVATVREWARTLDEQHEGAERMLGPEQHRVWRLYLAGGLLAFEENRMGVDQIVAVRPDELGTSGMPPVLREVVR